MSSLSSCYVKRCQDESTFISKDSEAVSRTLPLWVSNKGNPMAGGTIYDMVIRRTRKTLGFGVTLHRFRHAAPTLCLLMPGGGLAPHRLSDLPS